MRNLSCFKFLTFSGYVSQNSRTATAVKYQVLSCFPPVIVYIQRVVLYRSVRKNKMKGKVRSILKGF
nr:MAG TPA: hypothetical protein [Caudoviricetes sp.]